MLKIKNMKKVLLTILTLILIFSVSFIIGYTDSVALDDPTQDGFIRFNVGYDRFDELDYIQAGSDPGICLLPDTNILMADNSCSPIKSLTVGDDIMSFDIHNKVQTHADILSIKTSTVNKYLVINNLLKITPNHIVYANGGMKPASELIVGDLLINIEGKNVQVDTIREVQNTTIVYDITLSGPYTFYADGLLVHNIGWICRGYVEWDISSIPDEATITNTLFKYHGKSNTRDAHIHEMLGARPSTSTDQEVYDEADEGTIYSEPAGFPEVGTNKSIDLGTSADADLQSQLDDDWFAIGIQCDAEDKDGTWAEIYSEEYASTPDPTLYVEYTMPTPTGGTITTDGDYTVHTFLSDGTFTIPAEQSGDVIVLVVAGGGAGGGEHYGGGGGAGGLVYHATKAVSTGGYTVTIGAGGAGVENADGNNGSNSVFGDITAVGGGGGGSYNDNGVNGGSGGGGGGNYGSGGTATQGNSGGGTGYGNDGGGNGYYTGSGGGGAGEVGADGGAPELDDPGGDGGDGKAYTIYDGSSIYYAGGGGGGTYTGTPGAGGNGGGGAGTTRAAGSPVAGGTNTGGGGGGNSGSTTTGAAGGSGIVIVRYLTADFAVAVVTNVMFMFSNF